MEKHTEIINGLVAKIVQLEQGLSMGDLFAHKTDVDLRNIYVVTDIHLDIDKEEIYVVGSSHTQGVHQDGVAFKLVEVTQVGNENG